MTISLVEALALLTPWDVSARKARIGPPHDGGYVFLADLLYEASDVFSYGIDGEYQLDIELASKGHKVFMFDHTIDGIENPHNDPNLVFIKEGVGGAKDESLPINTIESHLLRYTSKGDNLILKMDVEGCEYDAFEAISRSSLRRFQQIVFEIHDLHHLGDKVFREKFYRVMSKIVADFTIHHVHANNYDGDFFGNVEGIPVANLLELSLVRSDLVDRQVSETLYPTPLDEPCVRPDDKKLWFFPFLPTSTKINEFQAAEKLLRQSAELKVLRG